MGWGPRLNQPCKFFLKFDPRVSELADPEIWHFPLTLLVVLTTLSHYCARCDLHFQHKDNNSSSVKAKNAKQRAIFLAIKLGLYQQQLYVTYNNLLHISIRNSNITRKPCCRKGTARCCSCYFWFKVHQQQSLKV